ncbi:hypothetical protein T02_12814, partial [Trichinella nativa]
MRTRILQLMLAQFHMENKEQLRQKMGNSFVNGSTAISVYMIHHNLEQKRTHHFGDKCITVNIENMLSVVKYLKQMMDLSYFKSILTFYLLKNSTKLM